MSSFVGSNLAEYFKDEYRVIGTYHRREVDISGVITLPCDVLNKDSVQLILSVFKPDFTIYCVGLNSLVACDDNQLLADALNTNGLFNVVNSCQRYKSQICYLSSCFVFNGQNRNYIEMDIPDSNTVYGRTQVSSEFYIQKTSLNYIILRCCKLYGRGISINRKNWFENLEVSLVKNKDVQLDDYIRVGFIDVTYLCMIIKIILKREVKNRLLQVNSRDITTHYGFGKQYSKQFSNGEGLLGRGMWKYPQLPTFDVAQLSRDKYFQMDILNVESLLKITLPSIEESLAFTYRKLNNGALSTRSHVGDSSKEIEFI